MKRQHKVGRIIFIIVILILILVFLFSGLQVLESTIFSKTETKEIINNKKTITRGEDRYFPRQDINVFLLMGIDKEGPVEESGSYNNDGAADTVMLLVFDEKDETFSIININRDTMLDMTILGIGGKPAGTYYGQLALSHTYGTGMEDSCENTRDAVSELFYGITIDHYLSMNMDAIGILNDLVDGVTVNVKEDFSAVDPTITQGELKLKGDQALSYVRMRKDVGDQLNVSRMERQNEYLDGFMEALKVKLVAYPNFVIQSYDEVYDYIVTDCSSKTLSSLMERYKDYTFKEMITLEGENKEGAAYMEFYPDEKALDELILSTFYKKK